MRSPVILYVTGTASDCTLRSSLLREPQLVITETNMHSADYLKAFSFLIKAAQAWGESLPKGSRAYLNYCCYCAVLNCDLQTNGAGEGAAKNLQSKKLSGLAVLVGSV